MDYADIKNIMNDKIKVAYIIAFAVICLIAYLVLYQYDTGKLNSLRASYSESSRNLDMLKSTADYSAYSNKFVSRFAVGKGTNWLIETVTELARDEMVTLELVKPLDSRNIYGYKIIRVSAEGRAAYSNILGLVSKIENHEKYLVVEDISLFTEDMLQQLMSRRSPSAMPGPSGIHGMPGRPPMAPERSPAEGEQPVPMEDAQAGLGIIKEPASRDEYPDSGDRTVKFKLIVASFGAEK